MDRSDIYSWILGQMTDFQEKLGQNGKFTKKLGENEKF